MSFDEYEYLGYDKRESFHLRDLQRIRDFRLIDDDFMNACFDGYIEGAQLLLRIILNKPDLCVKKVSTQKVMKNLLGRDIWLDIDANDVSGKEYNIEIQRADKGADRKRARYHSSILDAHLLHPAEDFSKLPETYVIFITEDDVIGDGLPLYTIERQITNTGKLFDDGEHIIYVNGSDRDMSTELGRLMNDFFCTDAKDMHYAELAEKVRYFKEDEKGVASMCKAMEDMRNEVAQEVAQKVTQKVTQEVTQKVTQKVAQETEEQTKTKSVLRWIAKGLSFEDIAEGEDLTVEQVRTIANMKNE